MMKNLIIALFVFLLISIAAFSQVRIYVSGVEKWQEYPKSNASGFKGFNMQAPNIKIFKTQIGNGFLLMEEIHQKWDSPNWISFRKRTYTYDINNNNLIKELETWLDGSGSKGKLTYFYDQNNNNLIEKRSARWDTTHWTNVFKWSYFYDANNNLIEEREQILGMDSEWHNSHKSTHIYDGNNNLIQSLVQDWNGSNWVNSARYTYAYDANNNQIEEVRQDWNGSNWANHWKITNTFDMNNNMIERLWQLWDDPNWINWIKYSLTYDGNNNMIELLYLSWNGSTWANGHKYTYTYDVNNNLIKMLWQRWEVANWVNYRRITYYHLPTGSEQVEHKRSNLNEPIEDFQTAEDDLIINSLSKTDQTLSLIGVEVLIDSVLHTSDSDLEFTLSHNGISDTIIYKAGGTGENFIWTKLTDNAVDSISGGIAPFTGNYKAENLLSPFTGTDPTGTWTLSIYDGVAGNTGALQAWGLVLIYSSPVGVEDEPTAIPLQFQLFQNYPNPFNPTTHIHFEIPLLVGGRGGFVTLRIYDILGREEAILINERKPPGEYQVQWNASGFPSGVYFYQLKTDDFIQTRKMLLVK